LPVAEEKKPESKVHKSLAEILGIPKRGEPVDQPKVAVVIDPKIAKVLRPHQIEGVKVQIAHTVCLMASFFIKRRLEKFMTVPLGVSWPMRWVLARRYLEAPVMPAGGLMNLVTMYYTFVDTTPTITNTSETNDPKMHYRLSFLPRPKLGKRIRQMARQRNDRPPRRRWERKSPRTRTTSPCMVRCLRPKRRQTRFTTALLSDYIESNRGRAVMIVSYESLRLHVDLIGATEIGLMLCDEGHRLKNGDSQTFTALSSLNVKRRVILSGTPIQNDLSEYYSLLSFANPNLLGTRQEFRSKYELAILKGRDASASDAEIARGDEKLSELLATVNKFIIRRTNDILSKYLPVKYEHVVFVRLSPMQKALYHHFLTSPEITKLLRGRGSQPLKAIGLLKKLCNHPDLLDLATDMGGCENLLPEEYHPSGVGSGGGHGGGRSRGVECQWSGKMAVLERMLGRIRAETNDKIVLISNYTQTLDLFEKMCRVRKYSPSTTPFIFFCGGNLIAGTDVFDLMGR